MIKNYRVILLAVLVIVIAFILLAPQLGLKPAAISQFAVTPEPAVALDKAEKSGKPVFLEFYAKW